MIAESKIFSLADVESALKQTYIVTALGQLFPPAELEKLSKIFISNCFQELNKKAYKGNEIIPIERMKKEYECLINN